MLRDSRVRGVVWCLIGVLAAAILANVLMTPYLVAQVHKTQIDGTPTGKKLVTSADRILDCTDPGDKTHPPGKCYAQNQRRTSDAVGQIGEANIVAVVCALHVPNGTPLNEALDQVTKCVADQLAAARR